MMRIKTVNIKNAKNILVQIPGFVAENWGVKEGDKLTVEVCEDTKNLIISPKRRVL